MTTRQSHRGVAKFPKLATANLQNAVNIIKQADNKTNILMLPALFREFEVGHGAENSAMEGILPILKNIDYIDHIVIGLDAADEAQYKKALKIIKDAGLPQNVHLVWNGAPDIENWRNDLAEQEHDDRALGISQKGKGRNVWGCVGYINALIQHEGIDPKDANIAMHDCDITTYDEHMVAQLFLPLCLPNPYEFGKAHFTRHTDETLNARVTRLFGPPFIDAVQNALQDMPEYNERLRGKLEYLRSFEYMFSGEMSFSGEFLNQLEIPSDYSIEVSFLDQSEDKLVTKPGEKPRVADIETNETYDHAHQGTEGLKEMVMQIAGRVFEIVEEEFPLNGDIVDIIVEKYLNRAIPLTSVFSDMAVINNLKTNPDQEREMVDEFAKMIPEAFRDLKNGKVAKPSHSWDTIMEQEPNAPAKLLSIVNRLGGQIKPQPQDPIVRAFAVVNPDQDYGPSSVPSVRRG